MNTKAHDAVYPYAPPVSSDGRMAEGYPYPDTGLNKRELFAAMMAQSLRRSLPDETSGQIALWAIADADALIRELAREQQPDSDARDEVAK